jgi:hypothetical protein
MPPKMLSSDPAREWAKHALEEQERQRLEELGRLSREREHEVWLDPGRICMNEIDQLVAGLTSAERRYICRRRAAPQQIQLSIKLLCGHSFVVDVAATATIRDVKHHLALRSKYIDYYDEGNDGTERPQFVLKLYEAGKEEPLPSDCVVGTLGTATLFLVPSEKRKGCYSVVVSGTKVDVPHNYSLVKPIAHGAYGVVISALNSETDEKVAIKKIPHMFDDIIDAKRILGEIKLLRHFQHENIISVLDILPPPSVSGYRDVYIISELMDTDLYRIIYSRQPLSGDHVQYFMYQILRALKYMHSANVVHGGLRPSNLLLNSNCDLKISDFSEAR